MWSNYPNSIREILAMSQKLFLQFWQSFQVSEKNRIVQGVWIFKLVIRFPGSGGQGELLGTEIGGFWFFFGFFPSSKLQMYFVGYLRFLEFWLDSRVVP